MPKKDKKDGLSKAIEDYFNSDEYDNYMGIESPKLASAIRLWISQNLPEYNNNKVYYPEYCDGWNYCLKQVKSKLLEEKDG